MADEDDDWRDTIELGGDQPRASTRRQLLLVAGILIASIAALVGLVIAGAAIFSVIGDRAHHTTRSYRYGAELAGRAGPVAQLGDDTHAPTSADAHYVCRFLVAQQSNRPSWLVQDEAIEGCAATFTR